MSPDKLLPAFTLLAISVASCDSDLGNKHRADFNEGFQVATPEELGLEREPLEKITQLLQDDAYPNVHALLIRKDGHLVYEEYFEGTDSRWSTEGERETIELRFDRDTLHDTRSVGKSIVSALVGFAIAEGAIDSVDEPLFTYFPEFANRVGTDKRLITLEHVITMSAGFDWNEDDVPYTNPENDEDQMANSRDPAGYVLAKALVNEPGSAYYYNGGLPLLTGFVVSRATEQSFGGFARERLFDSLEMKGIEWGGCCDTWANIPELEWQSDKAWAQYTNPAGSVWIRPIDLLKFGSLYLDDGRWNDMQILPADWVARSLQPHIEQGNPVREHGNGVTSRYSYGYFWWHLRYKLPYGEFTVHAAYGNGGQRIWVVPALDLVAVHMTGNYNIPSSSWHAERLLVEQILPWASNVKTNYRHEDGVPVHPLAPGEWPFIDIKPDDYVGDWEEGGDILPIRNNAGILVMTREGSSGWNLLPESPSVFAFGRVVDGVPVGLYWKDYRLVFIPDENGDFNRYEIRNTYRGLVALEGERVQPTGSH